jgi:hypothetical protein
MRLRAVALVAVQIAIAPPARSAELLGYGLRLETGVEHDSNPARLETVDGIMPPRPIQGSPALRLVSSLDLAGGLGPHLLSLSAAVAGKRFFRSDAQLEDLVIADTRAAGSFRLSDRWALAVSAGYYDVFQRAAGLGDARDFRSLTPTVRIERALSSAALWLGAGWRWFTFKPESAFGFHAPTLQAGYRQTLLGQAAEAADSAVPPAQWDLSASLSLEQRRFSAGRCPSLQSCPPPAGSDRRRDRFWAAQLDVTRTGRILWGAGLILGVNDSNSYGESLARLAASGRLVWLLPWQLSLAVRAELVGTRYREAVPVGHNAMTGTFVSVEDEGRSTVRVELVRPVGRELELGARYTFYSQTPGAGPVRFRRQIALLYLAWFYPPQMSRL